MIRVHVICEGQTEEMFLNEVLVRAFGAIDIFLYPTLLGKPGHKGGDVNLKRLFTDLRIRLRGDQTAYCTTLFDYYGLPADFPGRQEALKKPTIAEKARCVEDALMAELRSTLKEKVLRRFIPYVQMHEFEALLFSDPAAFAKGIESPDKAKDFHKIRSLFDTPEDINDGAETAPSKRILKLVPAYEKPIQGSLGAIEVGLTAMRQTCVLFDAWLKQLEALPEGRTAN